MMAIVILVCGTLVVMDSNRASLQAGRRGREEYAAALLLEGRMLEREKTQISDTKPEVDPILGNVSWVEAMQETQTPDWKEHRLTLSWGEGKQSHALELSTYLPE